MGGKVIDWAMKIKVSSKIVLGLLAMVLAIALHFTGVAGLKAGPNSAGVLAYIQNGDLWVKVLPAGIAQPLATGGNCSRPRWSPSGQWLAYRQGKQLWVRQQNGEDARLLSDAASDRQVVWSPVADRLAYSTDDGRLKVAIAPTWQEQAWTTRSAPGGYGAVGLAWSPNGNWLAFERTQMNPSIGLQTKSKAIDRTTGLWYWGRENQTETKRLAAQNPTIAAGWSSDNQQILFWQAPLLSASVLVDGVPLQAIDRKTGQPRQLVESMLLYDDFLDRDPESNSLAIAVGAGRETWTNKRIAVANLDNNEVTLLTDPAVAALSPTWSPDGQQIAYVAALDAGTVGGGTAVQASLAQRRVWVMNRDGSDPHPLLSAGETREERPLWSATGQQVLFASLNEQGEASLWLSDLAGSEREVVADAIASPNIPEYYGHINWNDYFDWWTE